LASEVGLEYVRRLRITATAGQPDRWITPVHIRRSVGEAGREPNKQVDLMRFITRGQRPLLQDHGCKAGLRCDFKLKPEAFKELSVRRPEH
jgi:hypothetical protein